MTRKIALVFRRVCWSISPLSSHGRFSSFFYIKRPSFLMAFLMTWILRTEDPNNEAFFGCFQWQQCDPKTHQNGFLDRFGNLCVWVCVSWCTLAVDTILSSWMFWCNKYQYCTSEKADRFFPNWETTIASYHRLSCCLRMHKDCHKSNMEHILPAPKSDIIS